MARPKGRIDSFKFVEVFRPGQRCRTSWLTTNINISIQKFNIIEFNMLYMFGHPVK